MSGKWARACECAHASSVVVMCVFISKCDTGAEKYTNGGYFLVEIKANGVLYSIYHSHTDTLSGCVLPIYYTSLDLKLKSFTMNNNTLSLETNFIYLFVYFPFSLFACVHSLSLSLSHTHTLPYATAFFLCGQHYGI